MPLQFSYSEICHYNSSYIRILPFYTSFTCLGPLSDRICVRIFRMDENTTAALLPPLNDVRAPLVRFFFNLRAGARRRHREPEEGRRTSSARGGRRGWRRRWLPTGPLALGAMAPCRSCRRHMRRRGRRDLAPSPARARPLARGRRSRRQACRTPHGPPRPAAPRLRPYSGPPHLRPASPPSCCSSPAPACPYLAPVVPRLAPHAGHPLPPRPHLLSPVALCCRTRRPSAPDLAAPLEQAELRLKNLVSGARMSLSEAAVVFSSVRNIRTHIRSDSGPRHVKDV